jgi:hypothetical protein
MSPAAPPHLRVFFHANQADDVAGWEGGGGAAGSRWLQSARAAGRRVAWTTKGLQEEEDHEERESVEQLLLEEDEEAAGRARQADDAAAILDDQPEELTTPDQVSTLLAQASIVVGLHPDQAAGEIVEFALARRLPFAVVPCCVYKREFPQRHLVDAESGANLRSVSNYADLCEWLKAKHPGIRVGKLDFEGKNTVLYMLPEDTEEI